MKVLLEQKDLLPLVSTVARASASSHAIQTLLGMKLEAKGGKLIATALDLEIGIQMSTGEVQVEEEGAVLVNARYLEDLVKKLPEKVITLNQVDNKLVVKYGSNQAKLNILGLNEWPGMPDKGYVEKFSISQEELKTGLLNTVYATAPNHFRQVFTGVLIDVTSEAINFVGTDTHRLAYYRYPVSGLEPFKAIIPGKAVNEIVRVLKGDEPIHVGLNGNNIIFSREDLQFMSRLVEGDFPNYLHVIPQSTTSEIKLKTAEARQCVERLRALPTDKKDPPALKIRVNGDTLNLKGHSDLMGEIDESMQIELTGDEMEIMFNAVYMSDAIKVMKGEESTLKFSGPMSPAILESQENYLVVLVPLRVGVA